MENGTPVGVAYGWSGATPYKQILKPLLIVAGARF